MVGHYVKIYIPPSHTEAVRRRRKCKHIFQWRGPLQINKALSDTMFEMISFFNKNDIFRRHVRNIRRWCGPLPATNKDGSDILPFASAAKVGGFAFSHDADFDTYVYMMLHCSAQRRQSRCNDIRLVIRPRPAGRGECTTSIVSTHVGARAHIPPRSISVRTFSPEENGCCRLPHAVARTRSNELRRDAHVLLAGRIVVLLGIVLCNVLSADYFPRSETLSF